MLSKGVQSDAIDAGPRRVARKRGVVTFLTLRYTLIAAAGVCRWDTIPRLKQRAREFRADLGFKAQQLTLKL